MITFIDEKGTEHSALVAYSVTNAVNGELSVKGTIYTNDKVLHGIGRGWRFRLDDEYYRITYAKPNDTGRQIEVEFDAVHQFFYDMSKSMVYTTLNGSKPFETYLQAIFSGSGYTYNLETTVGPIRKENFGNKSRLSLFNGIIKAAGLEFSVRGHVVRILKRIGTDLSTIVRKDFNMNELKIEKDINSFVTYQRGLGAWKDDEDHSKGRYETSYESPLSAIYGRIEADPIVDERYKETGKLLERLKENVDKSYKVSIEIDMEDLSRAGYRISRPNPGDYIMAINETLGFRQKVRIVSFTSEYDVGGNLISRKVICNDIGTVQRATSEISHLSRTLTDSIEGSERALQTATRALVSADGKNTNYFGDVKPLDVPKGTLRKGDRLFLTVGDKKQLYFWNGAEWELEPTEFDHEKFDMEFNRKSQEIKKAIQENRQKSEEALRNAGASTLLAQEAKRIGLDSIARLEAFKSQATSAQTALSGDLDALKRTIANDIRPKQEQVTAEIAKQVEALVQTKKELAGVKSAQATYEETTTRRLSELANLANGKASKSELTQTAEELASKIASVQIAHRNQGDRVSAIESNFKQRADALDAGVNRLTEGLRSKADISSLNVTADNIRQSVKSLETDTQNKLNQKLSLAEFEVRDGSIRQEILNATKDKADRTLVIAEAGKLREEFSKIKVGSRNYAEDYDFSRGLWRYHQGDNSPIDWKIINGEYNVKGTTKIWKQMQIFSKEGSRASEKNSTALLDLEIGETYTLSFQGICYSGSSNVWISLRANRTTPGNPEIINDNFNLTSSWQTYQVTVPALTKPDNFDFWRIILGYNEIGHVAFRKVELTRSSTRIDAGPAPEDGKTDLVVAKSEFQKTAEGLSTKLTAVETYINQDSQRQEALRRYTREESAKQATAVRELVTRDYVGKASYQEDVRGLERRFSEIATQTNNDIATKIAQYKQTVDGQFASITSQIASKANQTDFQRVKETSQLYERILGNSENGIADNVARMAMTSQLFQVEVSKAAKGGRNYVRNGQFKNGSKNWLEYQSVDFGLNFNYQHSQNPNNRNRPGLHFYHESQDVANFFGIRQYIAFDGVRGEKVSVSLLVSKDGGDSNSGLKVALHYIKNKDIIGQEWQNIPSPQITSKYKRFTFTFTLSDDVENLNLMLYGEKGKTINLYVTDVQLERGSVATDYKEAPEDTEEAIRTVQSQLAGSWSVQNINGAGDLVSGLNLGANGHNRLSGKLTHITGETLIDKAVIKSAMVDKLKTANFEAGSVTTVVLDAEAVTAEKLKVDQAFFNKLVANEAYLSQLFAKQAFINRVQSVAIDASQVRSGILSGDRIYGGTIRGANIFGGTLTGHTQIQLGSYGSFDTVNGGLQINVPRDYNAKDGLGVQFIGSYGRGENVPYGLFLYRDSDFTIGNTATDTDEFLMTVQGYINAKGIGWLKTGKGSVNGKTTGTIGLWNSDNVSLSFGGSGNDIYYSYNSTAYSLWSVVNQHFSDRRLKENIVDCKHKAIDYIHQFQFKEYDWKKQEDRPQQAHTKIGLIAQEVQTVDPTLVYENGDTLNLDNLRLTNIALKAIQELALENQKITHRLENLENEYRTA